MHTRDPHGRAGNQPGPRLAGFQSAVRLIFPDLPTHIALRPRSGYFRGNGSGAERKPVLFTMQLLGLAALWGGVLFGAVNAQITLSSLLVENQAELLGIDVSARFSRPNLLPTHCLHWWRNSGTVNSSNPYLAPYNGPWLTSDTPYDWAVAVHSSAGSASAQSTFSTGFLPQSDWGTSVWIGKNTTVVPQTLINAFTGASWIWTLSPGQTAPNAPPETIALRLTYDVPNGKSAANATILATADDPFTLWANGVLVGGSPNEWAAPISLGVSSWDTNVVVDLPSTPIPSPTNANWIWDTSSAASNAAPGDVAFHRTVPISTANKTAQSIQVVITGDDLFVLSVNGVEVGAATN
ncbi:hypothetical protein HMN09_00810000 [Mycena chlorophos]|uniref:Uncharacterized protein n=1 Tax=Mycena chlorophos TaxID=658473 RepID=A0A8H6W8I1_MYCCL|nr:hypothetical protein HMN09_00810000 [Mycena chlorophos]